MTNKVYSFSRGGIVFHDSSVPSRDSAAIAFLPSVSVIPLIQHSGLPAIPTVSAGDTVREGMLIGRAQGSFSANVHSTVPGKVVKIASWRSSGDQVQEGIVIKLEGSFEKLGKAEEVHTWEGLLSHDIQRYISEYGVVEMDGPGRPVSDIISSVRNSSQMVTLIVRCVFDDPWLISDYVLCKERARAVMEGAAIAARSCQASRIIIAVSKKEKELGDILLKAGSNWGMPVDSVLVSSCYPQRNRRELEFALRIFAKNEGMELGSTVIFSPATLTAVHDAVKLRKPAMERYIAVGGTAVKNPRILKVRIGTRIRDVFDECGGFKSRPKKIATGSPFLGRAVYDLDEPVTKNCFAVFANTQIQSRNSSGIFSSCIGCGECRAVCPIGLDPEEHYKRILLNSKNAGTVSSSLMDCHGCSCCELVCPSGLPLSAGIISSLMRVS